MGDDLKIFHVFNRLGLLISCLLLFLAFFLSGTKSAEAATYYWANWNTYNFDGTTYTLTGTITTATDTVTVTYTNTQGLAGYQLSDGTGGNTNYYSGGTDGGNGTSPYTSPTVENRPNNVTIVRLSNAGTQTLTFNKNVANLALAFVSLNGNAFSFDRNFEILSFGDPSNGGNACGFWGCGTATKTSGAGSYPYVVSGTGEPHGTLHFPGAFNSLTWTSGNENWHGFTVGIQGTSGEVSSDTTAPTVTINPANQTTNVPLNSDITITFNEEVRNLDDSPLTNTNVDALITLKSNNASGSDIPFDATIDVANKVITINPTADFSPDQIIYISIGATVEDTFGNAITATSATITTGSSFPTTYTDPRQKQDVVGNVQAWTEMAERWAKSNLEAITSRLDWLRRNKDTSEKSHLGLQIRAANPTVDGLVQAATIKQNSVGFFDAVNLAQGATSNQTHAMSNTKLAVTNMAFSQLAKVTQNATFGDTNNSLMEDALFNNSPWWNSFFGDWSMWSQGQVTFGRVKGRDSSPQQDSNDYHIFIGMDRPMFKEGLFGFSLGLGKSDTNVGSSGSGVDGKNYGFSGYAAYKLPTSQTLEAVLGYGRIKMDIVRIDSNQTLIGERNANQIFGLIALRSQPFALWVLSFSPYGRFEVSHTNLDAFTEEGGDLALTFSRQYLNTAMAFIGTDVDYEMKLGKGQLRPFGKLEYGLNVNYKSNVDMRYTLDTTDYRLTLDRRASSLWRAGLGFDYQFKTSTSVSLAYFRTQALNTDNSNSLEMRVSISF